MSVPRKFPSRILYVYLFWWAQWTILQILIVHHYGLDWKLSIIDSLVSNALLFGVVYTTNNIMRFYQPHGRNWYIGLLYILCIAFLCVSLFKLIQTQIFSSDIIYQMFLQASMPVRFGSSLLMITCSSMMTWIWNQLIELKENEQRESTLEKMAKESELMRIRQQLQPHFLFNSLNSINALIGSKPDQARNMIQQLSDFLRGTLRKDDQQLVTLEDELNHLQLYLDIEKVRFGHRLHIITQAEEQTRKAFLPPLLLQPIVENAIKFGLYDTLGEAKISIEAGFEQNMLVVRIRNPYDPDSAKPRRGTGYGLSAVERRLYLLFGRNDLLTTKAEDRQFSTFVKIPQSK